MKAIRAWQGVRMRHVAIGPDPDAPPRAVTLPASWDDAAAAALAWLVPGEGPVHLAPAAEAWIRPLAASRPALGAALHLLLRQRRGAPSPGIWAGQPEPVPGFVLNLAAFHDANTGFDIAGFEQAIDLAVEALTLAAPAATEIAVAIADLAGLLACLALDYDSSGARDLAACLAALLRARADAASAGLAGLFGVPIEPPPAEPAEPPALCLIPGLAAAAATAWAARPRERLRHAATCAVLDPGAAEALLGVETGGIAPAFSPLGGAGGLTRTARTHLSACGLSAEAALADLLAGRDPFAVVGPASHGAMRAAVAPYLDRLPALPAASLCTPSAPRELPARSRGYAQRATVGGHTVFLRTAEYADGSLAEIGIAPPRESAAFRGLMDCFCQSVSLGLQHGVPLARYVDAFRLSRFGPSGAVEGDDAVTAATSLLDYAFRNLAVHYLGRTDPPPLIEHSAAGNAAAAAPLLPLDLPRAPRLRLVSQ